MCGRFTLTIAREDLRAAFPFAADPPAEGATEAPAGLPPRWNIAPTQHVAVIANRETPRLEFFHWGLIPSWATDPRIGNRLINARAETLAEKPSFRTAFRKRRCLILADGFYEWSQEGGGRKAPMYIRLTSGAPFAFAGLWEVWRAPDGTDVCSCAIVTRAAEAPIAAFHARMPVILTPERYAAWLDPAPREPDDLAPLLAPLPAGQLEVYPVSRLVNAPANDVPRCIEPLRADALDPADPPRP